MAFIVIEKGSIGTIGRAFQLGENALIIGNPTPDSHPDIPIVDDYVSRKHAEISLRENEFMVRDLGSKNGSELNGESMEAYHLYSLREDSVIGLALINGEARVKLRFKVTEGTKGPEAANVKWIEIDKQKKEIRINGRMIGLTRSEYELLLLLYSKMGTPCSRDDIIVAVSKWASAVDPGAITNAQIDALIHRLREKVEQDPSNPRRIVSVRTFGYRLEVDDRSHPLR
jgi:DNA-binding winged helix-turn-helix (wHTH) protein